LVVAGSTGLLPRGRTDRVDGDEDLGAPAQPAQAVSDDERPFAVVTRA
jgi:hypothetical protein